MSVRRFWILLGCLFLLDLTKHALTFSVGPAPIVLDARQYWDMGGDVARGDWLLTGNRVDYRTPLYPMFLGVLRRLFGANALLATVVSQHVLDLAAGWLAAAICWQITRSRGAVLGAYALAAVCVTRPWFANTLLNEALFTFFLTATIAAYMAWHQQPSAGRAISWCGLLGLTILVRPIAQLLWVPLCGLCFLPATRWGGRTLPAGRAAGHVAAGLLMLAAVLSPWYVRNWLVFGDVFLTRVPAVDKWQVCFQGGSGAHLPIPAGPAGARLLELIGTPDGDVPDRYMYAVVAALERRGLSEREIDELVTAVCAAAIREHPLQFGWAAFKRFVNFWRCAVAEYPYYAGEYVDDVVAVADGFRSQRTWRFETFATAYEAVLAHAPARWLRWNEFIALVCGVGTAALVLSRRTRLVGLALAVVFAYFAGVIAAVGIENYRYRMVLEPCMIVAIACGAWCLSGSRNRAPTPGRTSCEVPGQVDRGCDGRGAAAS